MRQTVKQLLAAALLLIAVATPAAVSRGAPASGAMPSVLVVDVIDVGQGDAILIRTPAGRFTLVDTGDASAREKLIAHLKHRRVTTIDNLIITHPHADHLGGAAAVLENFTVNRVFDSGQVTASPLYSQYLGLLENKNIPLTALSAGREIDIGGAVLRVLSPPATPIAGDGLNNNSLVTRLLYGGFAMLLAADARQEAEEAMLARFAADLASQVLKSGHHGHRASSSAAFLQAVNPETAIISLAAGDETRYPHPATLRRYADFNIKVYRTDTDGTVTVTSDGKTYTVSPLRKDGR